MYLKNVVYYNDAHRANGNTLSLLQTKSEIIDFGSNFTEDKAVPLALRKLHKVRLRQLLMRQLLVRQQRLDGNGKPAREARPRT